MRYLFYFGHPAQYLFLRATIKNLLSSPANKVIILIKKKDVLEDLITHDGLSFQNILPKERKSTKLSILLSLFKRNLKLIPIVLKFKPNVMVGTDASIAQVGFIFRIPRITITEDDYEVIKTLARLTYPFTTAILCPNVCAVGPYNTKKLGYDGYMKLGYLHPAVFSPNTEILRKYDIPEKFVLLRLAKLSAHHDFGIKGISLDLLDKLIRFFEEKNYRVFLSSEAQIQTRFQKYVLDIEPSDLHHVLARAACLVSDSQSMSVEAAMLGVPSLRLSDFSGRISVLEELEHVYSLTFGFRPENEEKIFTKLTQLFGIVDLSKEFQQRRKKMLSDKMNVTAFLTWLFSDLKVNLNLYKNKPQLADRFKNSDPGGNH